MHTRIKFKLKDLKPDKDFIEWNNLMSKDFNQDEYYENSHPFIVSVEKKRLTSISETIKNHLKTVKLTNPSILEVGCGAGQVLVEITSKIQSSNIYGIDILDEWLIQTKKKLGDKVKLTNGFAENLPFENNSFDYIVCSEVLEHVIDPSVVLAELMRVVKKAGLIIVTIPDEIIINKIKDMIDFFRLYNKLFPNIVKHNDWHIHNFNLKYFYGCLPKELKISSVKTIPYRFLPLRYTITLSKNS